MTDSNGAMTAPGDTSECQARSPRSSADPEVLRDLLRQSRGESLTVRRITSVELQALKVTQRKEDHSTVALTRAVSSFLVHLLHAGGALFSGSKKKVTQCDIYGHVRPAGRWDGRYPTCVHCRIEITSTSMLRRATARI